VPDLLLLNYFNKCYVNIILLLETQRSLNLLMIFILISSTVVFAMHALLLRLNSLVFLRSCRSRYGATENAGRENDGPSKSSGMKIHFQRPLDICVAIFHYIARH